MKSSFHIFAHRGASHIYPENTLPAFREAIRLGATGLELDVQLSKDGHPVVIHDEYLDRTTDGKGLVKNHTLQELKELSAGAWFHDQFKKVKIPTLEEVLKKARPIPILLNIELKNLLLPLSNLEKEVIRLIEKYDMTQRIILTSFKPDSIKQIRQLNREITTAFMFFGKLDQPWKMALELEAPLIQPPMSSLTPELVENCRKYGLVVYPYHVDKWIDIGKALQCKVNGVITTYPERVGKFVE
ncbi:MAG TPA: glycerophosphodiester phosphodiesterase family protein [Bacillota bacterium]|nr:glycerophosphodiester phosphodiesterase family protein [Bacillota bacterium]